MGSLTGGWISRGVSASTVGSRLSTTEGPVRLAVLVGLAHLAWGTWIGITHPGLGLEPDLVANWLYFQRLLAGDHSLASLWYFPAPKVLLVFLLGPFADGFGVVFIAALASAVLAGSISFLVAKAVGSVAGLACGVLLVLDPSWTALTAIASGDLFLAAMVTAAIAAWSGGAEVPAVVAILLATLAKPTGAAAALPLMLDRSRSPRSRVAVASAAGLGLALTWVGYAWLLGSAAVPNRFLTAFTTILGGAPPLGGWLERYAVEHLLGGILKHTWPLLLVALVLLPRNAQLRSLRQLVAAASTVAIGYVVLAAATHTALAPRFLWLVELSAIGLAVTGSALLASYLPTGSVVRGTMVAALSLIVAADLEATSRLAGNRYAELFDLGARAAVPLIDGLRDQLGPEDSVNVPLWLQPATIWRLGLGGAPGRVEVAEIEAARQPASAAASRARADWVLLQPAYYETGAGAQWIRELASCGFTPVRAAELPVYLLRRDPRASCHPADRP